MGAQRGTVLHVVGVVPHTVELPPGWGQGRPLSFVGVGQGHVLPGTVNRHLSELRLLLENKCMEMKLQTKTNVISDKNSLFNRLS